MVIESERGRVVVEGWWEMLAEKVNWYGWRSGGGVGFITGDGR